MFRARAVKWGRSLSLLSLLWLCMAGPAPAQITPPRMPTDFSALVKAYGPAVVNIGVAREALASYPALDERQRRLYGTAPPQDNVDDSSLGSGFIVSSDGYILTNAHVVERGSQISVKLTDRREFRARLIGLDTVADVALLKIEANRLPTVRIGNPAQAEVGSWALAIGSPYGFSNSVTVGIISAKGRILPGADYIPFLQTDVPVNPGNSGGPLFNLKGEVIGINSRIYSRNGGYQGLSFAIPIDVAMRIKTQLQNKGTMTRGRIGVAVQEITQALADSFRLPRPAGALVSYVAVGSTADSAGLRPGDVILKVRGKEVVQSADALIQIADIAPGETAALTVWRERAPLVLNVEVGRFETRPLAARAEHTTPLGIVVRPLLPQELRILRLEGGLLVEQANAAATRAGLKAGDLILALNGQPLASVEALADEIRTADGAAALLVQRGSTRMFVPVELPRQVPPSRGANE